MVYLQTGTFEEFIKQENEISESLYSNFFVEEVEE